MFSYLFVIQIWDENPVKNVDFSLQKDLEELLGSLLGSLLGPLLGSLLNSLQAHFTFTWALFWSSSEGSASLELVDGWWVGKRSPFTGLVCREKSEEIKVRLFVPPGLTISLNFLENLPLLQIYTRFVSLEISMQVDGSQKSACTKWVSH